MYLKKEVPMEMIRPADANSGTTRICARSFALGFLLLALMLQPGFAQTAAPLAARIAKENLKSVVTLVALDKNDQPLALGSGFFTSANGLVATNAHVIEGAAKIVLRWQGKSGTADRIVKFSPRFDLVILQTSFSATPAVKLGNSDLITVGEEIVALGSPYGLEGTVSTGIISGIRAMDDIKYLQITAPISPGSSGGPIFNSSAVVVGIATSSLSSGQNLNFALPANILNQMPDSDITFSAAKHVLPESGTIQDYKDLVFVNNVIEHCSFSSLESVTYSIQNKTNKTVCGFQIIMIVNNYRSEVVDSAQSEISDCIAPGLARQFSLHHQTEGYNPNPSLKGFIELRILNFSVDRNEGDTLENLFKKK